MRLGARGGQAVGKVVRLCTVGPGAPQPVPSAPAFDTTLVLYTIEVAGDAIATLRRQQVSIPAFFHRLLDGDPMRRPIPLPGLEDEGPASEARVEEEGARGGLTVRGGEGSDVLNLDDTGDPASNTGHLTASSISGLGMPEGITYETLEHLNIHLGSGGDRFTIADTHGGETMLDSGGGSDRVDLTPCLFPARRGGQRSPFPHKEGGRGGR